ncbi:MAG: OmpA family protein [Nitrospirae bacterium]|nr:OmpA family protein [Candidatus Troglogloeales bacterium]MBI3598518.1 OmpA family protein [Candidatus Troglogloeales bacterium]
MKRMLQSVLTVFVGVSFLLLSGCPKKITPEKKSSKSSNVVQPTPSAELPKPPKPSPPTVDEDSFSGTSTPLNEVEIPPINQDTKSQEEKTSELADVFFDFDQWAPRPIDLPVIEKNVNWVIAHPNQNVQIEGHGDSRGTNEYNLVLGEKRADTVKNSMVSMGVDPSKLNIISYGEERPFCEKDEERCYQENRRAHFRVE